MRINSLGKPESTPQDFDVIFAMIWYGMTRFALTDKKLKLIIKAYHSYTKDIALIITNRNGDIKEYRSVLATIQQPGREGFPFNDVFEEIIEKNLMDFRLFTRCFKHLEKQTERDLAQYTARSMTSELIFPEMNKIMLFDLGRVEAQYRRGNNATV